MKVKNAVFRRRIHRLDGESMVDWSDLQLSAPPQPGEAIQGVSFQVTLRVKLLAFAVPPHSMLTVHDEAGNLVSVVQILEYVSKQKKFVKTYKASLSARCALSALVQHHELYQTCPDGSLEVYAAGGPHGVDLYSMAGWPNLRHRSKVWKQSISDLYGCLRLTDGQNPVDPALGRLEHGLLDDACPELLCLEKLSEQGWQRAGRREPLAPLRPGFGPESKKFNLGPYNTQKAYYQCLLFCSDMFERGLGELHHRQLVAYYDCLRILPDLSVVQPGHPAATYKKMLTNRWEGRPVQALPAPPAAPEPDPGLPAPEPEPLPLPAPEPDPGAQEGSDSDAIVADVIPGAVLPAGDADAAGHPQQVGAIEPECDGSSSSDDSESSSSGSTSSSPSIIADPAPGPQDAAVVVPATLEGQAVREEVYHRADGTSYRRLRVLCKHHRGCGRWRNVGPSTCKHLGVREPVAFLGCWLRANVSQEMHKRFKPTLRQMRDWLRENQL